MIFWTPENLAKVTGGRWLSPPGDPVAVLRGVSTDSRDVKAGQAFIALKGEKFDGHDFLAAVAKAGAGLLVVSDEQKMADGKSSVPALLVPDTLAALQTLAAAYRDALRAAGCKVIAVAGSNGKTTTRNLIHTVLSAKFHGTQSPKSFNNHIGVPLTLLAASLEPSPFGRGQGEGTSGLPGASSSEHAIKKTSAPPHPNPLPEGEGARGDDFVVVEVGTNHPGEIEALAKIVRPDAVVITSIGHEHMEFFKTLDGVAREEAAILRHIKPDGVAFIESMVMSRFHQLGLIPADLQTVVYGRHWNSAITFYDHPAPLANAPDQIGQSFTTFGGKLRITLPLVGEHNADNALAAVAVGQWMGVENEMIAEALAHARPVEMRLNVLRMGSVVVINDAYNANPDSMDRAIFTLRDLPLPAASSRRVVILGDMRELGEEGPELHRMIGRAIAEAAGDDPKEPKVHMAILIGRLALFMAESLGRSWSHDRIHAFPTWDDTLPARVAALLRPNDVVLIKASRGMKLERVLPEIEKKFGQG